MNYLDTLNFPQRDPPEPTEEEIDEALDLMLENTELSEGTDNILITEPYKFVEFFSFQDQYREK